MPDDRLDSLPRLFDEGEALLRDARSAARASADPGSDATGSLSVRLNAQGQVIAVSVATGWRRRLGVEGLPDAVLEAVRDAAVRRLAAWASAYGQGPANRLGVASGGAAAGAATVDRMSWDRDDVQRRLRAAATGPMSQEDRRAALLELLALAQAIERGIDEVSGKLQDTLNARYFGHSPDRHVTVSVTGGGEAHAVRFDRAWLRKAHEINVGRQITAAFGAAYQQATAHGVDKLIADSPLGQVQRATQDPLGLARRLRMTG
jgi:DNA-binding protein YbaB